MTEFYTVLADALLKIVIMAVCVATSTVVLPWLKQEVIPWLKEKHLYSLVRKLVMAAEKMHEAGSLMTEKKDYVVYLLVDRGVEITPEVNAFIESAVKELDIAVEQNLGSIVDIFEKDDGHIHEEVDGGDQADAPVPETDEEVAVDVPRV